MGSIERVLQDQLREARILIRDQQQTIRDLTDRIMYLSGKPYAPTPLELADASIPRGDPEEGEEGIPAGYTDDNGMVAL